MVNRRRVLLLVQQVHLGLELMLLSPMWMLLLAVARQTCRHWRGLTLALGSK